MSWPSDGGAPGQFLSVHGILSGHIQSHDGSLESLYMLWVLPPVYHHAVSSGDVKQGLGGMAQNVHPHPPHPLEKLGWSRCYLVNLFPRPPSQTAT